MALVLSLAPAAPAVALPLSRWERRLWQPAASTCTR
jgi:hypothetical protein